MTSPLAGFGCPNCTAHLRLVRTPESKRGAIQHQLECSARCGYSRITSPPQTGFTAADN